jgi:DNA mismatch endonuclease (patch repair protein)
MTANRRRDTTPEIAVRRALHARGLRFRVDYPVLPRRRADIVFPRRRVAVFIDGCFWHACPHHGTRSKSNAAYWADKLEANERRDRDTTERLVEEGWTVLRFWEHESVNLVVDCIELSVRPEAPARSSDQLEVERRRAARQFDLSPRRECDVGRSRV